MDNDTFHHKYPLSIKAALFTVCIMHKGMQAFVPELPDPTVKGAKDFMLFTGAGDSAIRTAISRERRRSNFIFWRDKRNILRFKMNESEQVITRFYQNGSQELPGLTLAVFQFTTAQNKDRYRLKEILRGFGFQMLTQNTYIHSRFHKKELAAVVEQENLSEHLFLFDSDYPTGPTLNKVKKIFATKAWNQKLQQFSMDLDKYLAGNKTNIEEIYNTTLYVGAALHIHIRLHLPPLPESLFPEKKIYNEIENRITDYTITHTEKILSAYTKLHGDKYEYKGKLP
jgi:DNA-binding transcriptional regulator PaaX